MTDFAVDHLDRTGTLTLCTEVVDFDGVPVEYSIVTIRAHDYYVLRTAPPDPLDEENPELNRIAVCEYGYFRKCRH